MGEKGEGEERRKKGRGKGDKRKNRTELSRCKKLYILPCLPPFSPFLTTRREIRAIMEIEGRKGREQGRPDFIYPGFIKGDKLL